MRTKSVVIPVVVGLILGLALLGKTWSLGGASVKAQTVPTVPTTVPTTIPTIPTAEPGKPGDHDEKPTPTAELAKMRCIYGKLTPEKQLDLFFPLKNRSLENWGGSINPINSACSEAIETLCIVPVHLLPQRPQLFYHREALAVWQTIKGKLDKTPSCKDKTIYFDLTRAERVLYDKDQLKIGIFWYNEAEKQWQPCVDTQLDPKSGSCGRLSCQSHEWGYFALGWPSKKK